MSTKFEYTIYCRSNLPGDVVAEAVASRLTELPDVSDVSHAVEPGMGLNAKEIVVSIVISFSTSVAGSAAYDAVKGRLSAADIDQIQITDVVDEEPPASEQKD